MSFKKEVRKFIQEFLIWKASQEETIKVLKEVIETQQRWNDDLHNKLLARNLPELKTYSQEYDYTVNSDYDPRKDLDAAGLIADFGENEK